VTGQYWKERREREKEKNTFHRKLNHRYTGLSVNLENTHGVGSSGRNTIRRKVYSCTYTYKIPKYNTVARGLFGQSDDKFPVSTSVVVAACPENPLATPYYIIVYNIIVI